MKAAVDLTIIKTEKVDIELFPSPGKRPARPSPSFPRSPGSPVEPFSPFSAARGKYLPGEGRVGYFLGGRRCIWEGKMTRTPQVAAERRRPGSARRCPGSAPQHRWGKAKLLSEQF